MNSKDRRKLIIFINLMFLLIGLLMSIMSAIIPEMIRTFHISYGLASALPSAFFIAIAVTCVPAGIAGEYYAPRYILIFSFLFGLVGILIFVLSSTYWTSILSLFIIGSMVAIIQVIAVPLLRRTCGPENLTFHTTLNNLMYGAGAFFSPLLYTFLSKGRNGNNAGNGGIPILSGLTPKGFEWTLSYWFFALLLILLVITIMFLKFPLQEKLRGDGQTRKEIYLELFKNKYVFFFFISLVAYGSCEQGIAAWMSEFFHVYHGLDPQTKGASILSFYWLLLTGGCFGGMLLLSIFDSRKVLAALAVLSIISLAFALHGGTTVSKISFPLVGAFESVMWPIILSLAINSVPKHHEILSGVMYTASLGGALGPFLVGTLGDSFGLRASLDILFFPFLIVLSVAFWAKPLVANKTI
ncbi:MAG TPA: MFS transporter [Puia sp.]|nr:MFS transporter [Puia sp.]